MEEPVSSKSTRKSRMALIVTIFLFCTISNSFGDSQPTSTIDNLGGSDKEEHFPHIKSYMSPFIYPQLYSCIKKVIPVENEFHSQSNEDKWLWKNVFEKLPRNEVLGGTFLEIGGLDGVDYSNTYFFEKKFDWRGILIEGHPDNDIRASQTLRNNTAIFTVAVCDAVQNQPGNLTFTAKGGPVGAVVATSSTGFLKYWHKRGGNGPTVSCIPIQAIIDATGLVDIDLFSLDVEGGELAVLETLDFGVTNIRVLVVELDGHNPEKDDKVRSLMISKGFKTPVMSIRNACRNKEKECMRNEVFINPNYDSRKTAKTYYHYGTGVKC